MENVHEHDWRVIGLELLKDWNLGVEWLNLKHFETSCTDYPTCRFEAYRSSLKSTYACAPQLTRAREVLEQAVHDLENMGEGGRDMLLVALESATGQGVDAPHPQHARSVPFRLIFERVIRAETTGRGLIVQNANIFDQA